MTTHQDATPHDATQSHVSQTIASVPKNRCTGCGACQAVCPKQAIVWERDGEGFPYPAVGESCVSCGLCETVCPALHPVAQHPIAQCYAAQIRDRAVLADSTSGGVFTALARAIFAKGGVVFGCVWDNAYHAYLTKAETEADLPPMRGSKYVWSLAGDAFPVVRQHLNAGQPVLVSALPCQIAGLRGYLQKSYENLYLLDCLCSGAPSPLALERYLDTLCPAADKSSLHLKFRDKQPHGVGVHITYHGQTRKPARSGEHLTNPYYYAFYSHLLDRRSCYQCPYGTDHRVSDFTMGDYWGIQHYHPTMDIRAGVSALMVHTEKAAALLADLPANAALELVDTRKEDIARANNLSCGGTARQKPLPACRDGFFAALQADGWQAAERKYLHTAARRKQCAKAKLAGAVVRVLKFLHLR